MDLLSIALIGLGLSMDAFAVSVTSGITIRKLNAGHLLKIGGYFGGFQALMPAIGWAVGSQFKNYIISIDHWIAFGLLFLIGAKMVYEVFEHEEETGDEGVKLAEVAVAEQDALNEEKQLKAGRMLMLAIATSIDALAVGVSFAFLQVSIISASLLIGVITFVVCVTGALIGKRFGDLLKNKAEIAGGLILILIGLNILNEHLNFLGYIF
ncbi:MAG: manganese efflux pump MntP family protein [Caulobacteraceae bacterium]